MANVTNPNRAPYPSPPEQSTNKRKRWYLRWKPYFFAVNVFTLLALIWYACITHKIWKETTKSADAAKTQSDILRLQQRPWVVLFQSCLADAHVVTWERCTPNGYPALDFANVTVGALLTWRVTLKNTGNSPALDATLQAAHCISFAGEDTPPDLHACTDQMGSMAPRPVFPGADPVIAVGDNFRIGQEDLEKLRKGAHFYIIAHADYFESYGTSREFHATKICMINDPNGQGQTKVWSLRYCRKGNSAT
jgi:hypothetical protein